jgi:hypothetical protein
MHSFLTEEQLAILDIPDLEMDDYPLETDDPSMHPDFHLDCITSAAAAPVIPYNPGDSCANDGATPCASCGCC